MKQEFPRKVIVIAFLFILGVIATRLAHAHDRVEVGPYIVVVGWVEEPAIVGERNAIFIEITEDEMPVEGVDTMLPPP